mgnify:CR=1 FL=1
MALNVMAVATHRVISVDATTPIDEVCALFAAKRIKKVPVVENGSSSAPVPPQHHALARGGYRHPGEVGLCRSLRWERRACPMRRCVLCWRSWARPTTRCVLLLPLR